MPTIPNNMKVKKFLFGSIPESTSRSGSLNKTDLQKTGRLLLVAIAGSAATAALDFVAQWLTGADLKTYKAFVMPVATMLIELGRRYVADHLKAR